MGTRPRGLVASIQPDYLHDAAFAVVTNCFTTLTSFDAKFMGSLQVTALRPEELGWTKYETRDAWIAAVGTYFSTKLAEPQRGSGADRHGKCSRSRLNLPYVASLSLCASTDLRWTVNSARALCFPMIKGASDYHWAIFTGTYWLEQAGRGGPVNLWATEGDLIADVYTRGDGKRYVEGSHFYFMMPVDPIATPGSPFV
jgi:hypothetical protein